MSSVADHLDDIDWRSHEERRAGARFEMLEWHADLRRVLDGKSGLQETEFNRTYIEGQLQMLGACLWLVLPEKELKAFRKGYKFVDQDAFTPEQKKLFMGLQAFNGSPYCRKDDAESVIGSYIERKPAMVGIVEQNRELAENIAHNIVVKANREIQE